MNGNCVPFSCFCFFGVGSGFREGGGWWTVGFFGMDGCDVTDG